MNRTSSDGAAPVLLLTDREAGGLRVTGTRVVPLGSGALPVDEEDERPELIIVATRDPESLRETMEWTRKAMPETPCLVLEPGSLVGPGDDAKDETGAPPFSHSVAQALRRALGIGRPTEIEGALIRSEDRHRVLQEISSALISNIDRKALLAAISNALLGVLSFDFALLTLRAPDDDSVLLPVGLYGDQGFLDRIPPRIPIDGTHVGWVVSERRPLIRTNLPEEPHFTSEDGVARAGIRSYLVVPLQAKGSVIGTLNLASAAENRFTTEDASFVQEIANQVALAIENMLAYEEIERLRQDAERENIYLHEELRETHPLPGLAGGSLEIQAIRHSIRTVAPTRTTVLIQGEIGSGKELVARTIHELSELRDHPIVTVRCSGQSGEELERTLFGDVRGEAGGPVIGRVQLADRGTLYLDDVAALSDRLQRMLLRTLEDEAVLPIGADQPIPVRFRLLVSGTTSLAERVEAGRFRADLFYRLNVFPIQVPPLRDRKEDILPLVEYFVARHSRRLRRTIDRISKGTLKVLTSYDWPGNVRELENLVERAVILSRDGELRFGPLDSVTRESGDSSETATLEEVQREHILRTLQRTRWRVSGAGGAAELLDLRPTTLWSRMKKLGISRMSEMDV